MNETCQSRCVSAMTKLPLYFLMKNVMIERQPACIKIVKKPVEKLKFGSIYVTLSSKDLTLTWCDASRLRSQRCWQFWPRDPLTQTTPRVTWGGKHTIIHKDEKMWRWDIMTRTTFSGAQGVTLSVFPSACPAQVCIKQWIFIFLS